MVGQETGGHHFGTNIHSYLFVCQNKPMYISARAVQCSAVQGSETVQFSAVYTMQYNTM